MIMEYNKLYKLSSSSLKNGIKLRFLQQNEDNFPPQSTEINPIL